MAKWKDYSGWYSQVYSGLSMEQKQAILDYLNSIKNGPIFDFGGVFGGNPAANETKAKEDAAMAALAAAGYSGSGSEAILDIARGLRLDPESDTVVSPVSGNTLPGFIEREVGKISAKPGADVDTTQVEEDKKRTQDFLNYLQQQAATGGGAWEKALEQGTQAAKSQQQSLWQSTRGVNAAQAMTGLAMGNAAAEANAAQQAAKLREQTKQQAQQQILGVTSGQEGLEAAQAADAAAARAAAAEASDAMQKAANDESTKIIGAVGQGLMKAATMSKGGHVPGKARVFGDDERNDTVPAMLSPGEIVIPRSVAQSPDAARKSADFVAAVKAKGGQVEKRADGGETGAPKTWEMPEGSNVGFHIDYPWAPAPVQHVASVERGSKLETGGYNAARAQFLAALEGGVGASALGAGPSTVTADIGADIDRANAAAMRSGRHGASPLALRALGAGGGRMAGAAAQERRGEQARAMEMATQGLYAQQQQDLAFAKAQQQAMWANTLRNYGLDLAQRQAMMNMLSAAGQGAASMSENLGQESATMGEPEGPPPPAWEEPNDAGWAQYPGESSTDSGYSPSRLTEGEGEGLARGGMVGKRKRTADFLRAMGGR